MKDKLLKSVAVMALCLASGTTLAQSDSTVQSDIKQPALFAPSNKSVASRQKYDEHRHQFASLESIEKAYGDFKKDLNDIAGLSYSLDISVLAQRGAPNGSKTAFQTQYYGSANWQMFDSAIGSGSLQAAYTYIHYWGKSADWIGNRIGVINSINDYPSNEHNFDQLSYTHTLPDELKSISITLGQFPMYTFDGSAYDANQQINFVNFALSQNATSSYPTASLGGYVSFTPNDTWNVTVGMQDANNTSGSKIQTSTFHRKQFTSFASLSFTPTIAGLGAGQYSVMVYNQPWTKEQSQTTNGWSFNVSQAFGDKLTLFGRVNGVTGNIETISQSYVLGGVVNNPFNRNALDQFGFATAINKMNRTVNGANTRAVETVFEGYMSFGVSNFLILTPDVQFYINPAQDTSNSHSATAVSLRATLMF